MIKKISVILAAAVISLFAFAGCGGSSDPSADAKACVDGFLSAMQAGDMEKAKTFATEDAIKSGQFDISKLDTIAEEFTSAVGLTTDDLSDESKAKLDEFGKTLSDNLVTAYEVGEATVNDDATEATVSANVTMGFNPDKVAEIEMDDELNKILEDYMSEHQSELAELYNSEGQEGMAKKLVNDLLGTILDKFSEAMLATGETSSDITVNLTNGDDGWKISGFGDAQ